MIEDGLVTATSLDQVALEQRIAALYADLVSSSDPPSDLLRRQHVQYLHSGLGVLPGGFVALDAGRPWLCYWVVHALALLDAPFPPDVTPAGAFARAIGGHQSHLGSQCPPLVSATKRQSIVAVSSADCLCTGALS